MCVYIYLFISMTGPSDDHSISSGLCCEWVKNEKVAESRTAGLHLWVGLVWRCSVALSKVLKQLLLISAETGNTTT